MNKLKSILGNFLTMIPVVVFILALGVISCRTMLDKMTPADISPQAADYVGYEPTVFNSLYDARNVRRSIVITHRETQKELLRKAEDDRDYYSDAIDVITYNISESEQFQAHMVGDERNPGLLGYLAGVAGLGSGLTIGRRFLKRPGDLTPEEAQLKTLQS